MFWKMIIHFKDGRTHELGLIDSLEGATEKIHKVFEDGLTIKSVNRYVYYPPGELKMGEMIKEEQKTS